MDDLRSWIQLPSQWKVEEYHAPNHWSVEKVLTFLEVLTFWPLVLFLIVRIVWRGARDFKDEDSVMILLVVLGLKTHFRRWFSMSSPTPWIGLTRRIASFLRASVPEEPSCWSEVGVSSAELISASTQYLHQALWCEPLCLLFNWSSLGPVYLRKCVQAAPRGRGMMTELEIAVLVWRNMVNEKDWLT